jgi:folate-binding protein YgfZ
MSNPEIASPASPQSGSTLNIAGQDIVVAYGDVGDEYHALRTGAIVIDRSHRGRMRFFGESAGDALTGLVTTDVLSIQPGHGRYGAALSAKGRIVADVRILAMPGFYLVDTPARAWPGFVAMVKKYVNPRLSGYRDESYATREIGIYGPTARRVVAGLTGVGDDALAALEPYDHVTGTFEGTEVTVVRSPDLGVEGFDVLVPLEVFARAWEQTIAARATPAGLGAWEIARVEAGRPEWGVDIDDTTIPQEANFDELDAISYTKGCYIGQEVVARVHFRGHVNRHLRGLRAPGAEPAPTGAQLIDDSGNHVGDVRSSASSPRLGGIALGMVRREVAPGTSLTAKWESGERRVNVTGLPFPG